MGGIPDQTTVGASVSADAQEKDLVSGLRAGSQQAFTRLVREYSPRMLAVARRLLNSDDDAQDALQDAFISVHRSIHNFEGTAKLSTWLHRIVVNASLMKLRSRKHRNEQSIEPLLPTFLEDGHQANPSREWDKPVHAAMQSQETREFVRNCIEELPESYRTVLKLRDLEELDTETTAGLLNIESNLVKVRLHRARQALRVLLDKKFSEYAS